MADSGTPLPADRYHAHFEKEAIFAEENAGFPAAAESIRLEAGSTFLAQHLQIPDETLKEDDGSDESGVGDPEVSASFLTKSEGNGLVGGAGDGVLSGENATTMLLECAFANTADIYAGALAAGVPTTTIVLQITGAADFVTDSVAIFHAASTGKSYARHIADATLLDLTLSMALPVAPVATDVIYGTTVIPIERSHDGLASPTLQVGLKDPNQIFNRILYGLGCSNFEIQDAAKGANRNLKTDFMGADFSRGDALAVTQPDAQRGRSGTNRQVWLAPIGSAQVATCFTVFNFSWRSNHDTQEVPTCGDGLANNGYNYQLKPDFTMEVYQNSVAIGSAGNWMEAWEDGGTDNEFQLMYQDGRTPGRILFLDLVNVLIEQPVVGEQNKRATYILTGRCRTGTAENFGNIGVG